MDDGAELSARLLAERALLLRHLAEIEDVLGLRIVAPQSAPGAELRERVIGLLAREPRQWRAAEVVDELRIQRVPLSERAHARVRAILADLVRLGVAERVGLGSYRFVSETTTSAHAEFATRSPGIQPAAPGRSDALPTFDSTSQLPGG